MGMGENVRSNVEKKSMNSDECSFSGWMLKIDHHNTELEKKGDSDCMEFKRRPG